MMSPQIIDGTPFFGRNMLTAQEAIAEQQAIIDQARTKLAELGEQERRARAALEAALIADEPTDQQRQKLASIATDIAARRRSANEAEGRLAEIHRHADTAEASRIIAAGSRAIAATLQSLEIPETLHAV